MPGPNIAGPIDPSKKNEHPASWYLPLNAMVSGIAQNENSGRMGIAGISDTVGVYGQSQTGSAGRFKGKVEVEGDIEVTGDVRLTNADCAEDFDASHDESIEPGTVMVLGHDGKIQASCEAYDRRVAGVISGAGGYKPGIVLDNQNGRQGRFPIALLGKVYCKVDAQYGEIEPGDLLTTSPTTGHAMKASDTGRAFGAVIGKALGPWQEGQGLVPMLVVLQ